MNYPAWRISFQCPEQAARAAFEQFAQLSRLQHTLIELMISDNVLKRGEQGELLYWNEQEFKPIDQLLNISSKRPNQLNGLVLARADLLLKWQSQLNAQQIALEQILKEAGLQHAD